MKLSDHVYLLASGALGTALTHPNDCNVYAIDCDGEYVLIDAGVGRETERILDNMRADKIAPHQVKHIFLTHGHLDHSGGAQHLRQALSAKVCASMTTAQFLEVGDSAAISLDAAKQAGIYPEDFLFQPCPVDLKFIGGEHLSIGRCQIEVVSTPGHSGDSVCYLIQSPQELMLFSGDTLFFGGRILLSNIYDCDVQDYVRSLRQLAEKKIDGLYPGHQLWVVRRAFEHVTAPLSALDRLLLPPNII